MAHHTLVFGASDILDWSVVDQILKNYPDKGTFSRVTALSNRLLKEENAFWPANNPNTPKLHIVDGVDLTTGSVGDIRTGVKARVPSIESVSHIYYFGKHII